MSSTEFEMDQTVDGHIYVTVPSSVTIIGGSLAVGDYVQVTGTGWSSSATNITAVVITIWSSPPSTTTVTGTISQTTAYGFTLTVAGQSTAVPIIVNASATVSGGTIAAGDVVTVAGVGSASESVTATTITITRAAPQVTPAPIATPDFETTQGTVYAIQSTSEFALDQTVDGYINIDEPSNVLVFGGTIAKGDYVQVTGTGWSTAASLMTAAVVSVWSSAPPSVTVTGTVVASTSYGFTLDVSSQYPTVPIVLNTKTIIAGGTLAAGASVTVTGTGSTAESIIPVQVVINPPVVPATPTPGPISQTHVLTADYLGTPWGSGSVTFSQAAPYVSWAQSAVANATALHNLGIHVQVYEDPNRTEAGEPMDTSDQTTYAQSCSGVDITDQYNGATQYVMNPSSSDMQTLFRNTVANQIGSNPVDAIFADDSGPLSEYESTFSPSLPCNYTDAAWLSGGIALDNASPVPVIFNGLSVLDGESPSESLGLLAGSNTIGGNFESCYSGSSIAKSDGWLWQTTENTELDVTGENKLFWCMTYNTTSAASETDVRLYVLASFLMTYNPTDSILWERFSTTSGLHVMPESGLVALDPLVAAPSNVSSLQQSGGAYGRQFGQCYMNGAFVGPCAVAVNPNSGAQAIFPFPQYQHTLVLSGSDVLDGGTAATNGPPPPTYLPADGEAIVFP
ncbi:MAG: hypothetical protein WBD74_07350 [Candidatus Aquilonibacter sp.]